MNRDEIITSLKKMKGEISKKYRVKKIGIFGSYARGNPKTDSDIDIYAEFDQEADLLDYSGLISELEDVFQKPIDVATPLGIREEMRKSIYRDLIMI